VKSFREIVLLLRVALEREFDKGVGPVETDERLGDAQLRRPATVLDIRSPLHVLRIHGKHVQVQFLGPELMGRQVRVEFADRANNGQWIAIAALGSVHVVAFGPRAVGFEDFGHRETVEALGLSGLTGGPSSNQPLVAGLGVFAIVTSELDPLSVNLNPGMCLRYRQ